MTDRLSDLAQWWSGVRPGAEPATVEHIVAAEAGVARELAVTAAEKGADLVLLTVPSSAATPWAANVAVAALLDLDAAEVAGWPSATGMGDAEWITLVGRTRDELRRLRGPWSADHRALSYRSPADLLERLDDGPLVAGCAVIEQCAEASLPLIIEGADGAVSALLAQRADPPTTQWWQLADGPVISATHLSGARGGLHERVLSELGAEPLLRLGLHEPDGTAARLALTLLRTALERSPGGDARDDAHDDDDDDGAGDADADEETP